MRMLLKSSQRCRRTERRISWNATGVQGLPGSTGSSGQVVSNADPRLADPRPPTGPAAGDLKGSYPDPELGTDVVTSSEVAPGSLRLSDTSTVVHQFDADPASIAAGTCAHIANLFSSAVDVGDIAAAYLPDNWDARILSTPRRVTAGGVAPIHACNIGSVALNPPSGRGQIVVQR